MLEFWPCYIFFIASAYTVSFDPSIRGVKGSNFSQICLQCASFGLLQIGTTDTVMGLPKELTEKLIQEAV